jgi:hypothetical protein
MDYQEFKDILKKCNLSIKEFANLTGLNEKSISGKWKSKNEVPKWAVTWLENYQKAQIIDDIKEKICPVKGSDE